MPWQKKTSQTQQPQNNNMVSRHCHFQEDGEVYRRKEHYDPVFLERAKQNKQPMVRTRRKIPEIGVKGFILLTTST
jgi:hypothetical protein